MNSLQSQFLVASPHLPDSNFFRSIVLMLEHNDEGASGVVINRPSNNSISKIWDLLGEGGIETSDFVYVGGPVPGPLLALHTHEELGDSRIMPDLFITSQKDRISQLVRQDKHAYRLFSSYAGWAADQLESELKAGGWLTTPARIDEVFSDHNQIWDRITRRINLSILSAVVDESDAPQEAWLN